MRIEFSSRDPDTKLVALRTANTVYTALLMWVEENFPWTYSKWADEGKIRGYKQFRLWHFCITWWAVDES